MSHRIDYFHLFVPISSIGLFHLLGVAWWMAQCIVGPNPNQPQGIFLSIFASLREWFLHLDRRALKEAQKCKHRWSRGVLYQLVRELASLPAFWVYPSRSKCRKDPIVLDQLVLTQLLSQCLFRLLQLTAFHLPMALLLANLTSKLVV